MEDPSLVVLGRWPGRLISTLTGLVGLTKLNVFGTWQLTLQWCSALTNLRELHAGCSLVHSLEGPPDCPQLTKLKLPCCDRLQTLERLQGCPQLTELDLSGCTSISSLEPLTSCPKLATLNPTGCPGALPKLQHLRGLPGLRIIGP